MLSCTTMGRVDSEWTIEDMTSEVRGILVMSSNRLIVSERSYGERTLTTEAAVNLANAVSSQPKVHRDEILDFVSQRRVFSFPAAIVGLS